MTISLIVKIIYNIVISILLLFLVIFGINVFYNQPKQPSYIIPGIPCPVESVKGSPSAPCNTDTSKSQSYYDALNVKYTDQLHEYDSTVSLIALLFAVVFALIGIVFYYKIEIFSFGFLFGGLLTFFYSLGNATASENTKLQFIVVLVAFIMALIIGYLFFLHKKVSSAPLVSQN